MIDGLVSIVTPCYNGSGFIAETIESVRAQTWTAWEMIVVDDGSTDDSATIVEGYAASDERIQLIRQTNGGSSSARNNGIRRARGRYIALLDADDLWDASFLEEQLRFMKEKGAACVCCGYRHIDERSKEIQHPTAAMAVIRPRDMRVMNRIGCLTGLYDTAGHGKVFLREELRSIRDDYAYWYDIVSAVGRAYGNPKVLASYRVLTGSTTGNKAKLIKSQYRFYRETLGESAPEAAVNLARWALAGLIKFS